MLSQKFFVIAAYGHDITLYLLIILSIFSVAAILDRARALGVEHKPPAPILLGRHLIELGVAPGPRMGEILRAVYELQLDGVVTTLDQAIQQGKRHIANQQPGDFSA